MYVLLSRTQSGPGRAVKQEQEEISRNHVQTFIYLSVDIHGIFFTMDLVCALRLPYHTIIPPARFSSGEARTNTDYIQSAA